MVDTEVQLAKRSKQEIVEDRDTFSHSQQDLCGKIIIEEAVEDGSQERPKKPQNKSQRRMEKEKEWHLRQQRMHEAQKLRMARTKQTPCRFFQQGRCKLGSKCTFSHEPQ